MQILQSLFTKCWIFVGRKKNIFPGKSEYHNRFFPISVSCTFTFPCLVIYLNLLGPLVFISMLFINVDIVIKYFFRKCSCNYQRKKN